MVADRMAPYLNIGTVRTSRDDAVKRTTIPSRPKARSVLFTGAAPGEPCQQQIVSPDALPALSDSPRGATVSSAYFVRSIA
jgi:hypothetical protein